MELIVDSADLEAVREIDSLLTVSGVTTNPSIIIKSGKDPERAIGDLLAYLRPDQKFFAQVVRTDFEGIMEEARAINALRPENTYAKIPVTRAGLRAIKAAKQEGLNVLATSIHTAEQGFLAAMNGADYLAPYVNRMCNYGDGVGRVLDLIEMLAASGLESKVMGASFHNVEEVHELLRAGVDAVTVPPNVIELMMDHPGTKKAVDEFSAGWQATYGRDHLFA
ncbi:transaldolase family protein [Olsenella profusa]|uniref:Fructose-6-phosphate aldolase n=1 Tax=Olsenella profusa TaxID=138595 RepID=A0ABS2F0F4_9ACTN|nr:transaldolase family protein [Olsenella profusa]MBM6774440.1 fructose-6-phosphate aldolase [Olsenella profusa]